LKSGLVHIGIENDQTCSVQIGAGDCEAYLDSFTLTYRVYSL
jgi:hypothetical protein